MALEDTRVSKQVAILSKQIAVCFKLCETFSRFYLSSFELAEANSVYCLSVAISLDIRKHFMWWKSFLPRYNGISMMDMDDFSESDSIISTNACPRGCGGWFAGRYFHSDFQSLSKSKKCISMPSN